jgi:hypothetical protein
MSDVAAARAAVPGYLLGPRFDLAFMVGVPVLALTSGLVVAEWPRLLPLVLFLDLWLLGYHHVIATYTRLCFDAESYRRSRFLLFGLPAIILAVTLAMAAGLGLWSIATLYLYWQWFHYTRQSWGIAQIYRRKSGLPPTEPAWLAQAAFYLLPVCGILYRSWQAPDRFIGMEIRVLAVPLPVVQLVGAAALIALLAWAVLRVRAWLAGELPMAQTLYLLSHHLVFFVAYLLIDDITVGWLAVNIWHNLQYLLFVWLFNSQRFRQGRDPKAALLSYLSQPGNFGKYFAVCLAISTAVYLLLQATFTDLLAIGLPVIIVYQVVNFHHYVVDALIWKARRKPLQKVLGLPGSP